MRYLWWGNSVRLWGCYVTVRVRDFLFGSDNHLVRKNWKPCDRISRQDHNIMSQQKTPQKMPSMNKQSYFSSTQIFKMLIIFHHLNVSMQTDLAIAVFYLHLVSQCWRYMVISPLTELNWQRTQLARCCFGVLCVLGPGAMPRRWCGQLARLIPLVCS